MKRAKAMRKLEEAIMLDESFCEVDGQKVKVSERDELLQQLRDNKIYLKVPVELYLTSQFWRELKTESNLEVRQATR